MIRSNALRSTVRSRTTGNAPTRHGSMVIVSPSLYLRMWIWQVVVPLNPPWATPLMTMLHVPQIPSRQSWSKAIGSSPFLISSSLTTSSISRNDMSGLTSRAGYVTMRPGLFASFCRQTWRVRFIGDLFVAPNRRLHLGELQRLLVLDGRLPEARILPGADVLVLGVISLGLAVGILELLAEMPAAGFVAGQGVERE